LLLLGGDTAHVLRPTLHNLTDDLADVFLRENGAMGRCSTADSISTADQKSAIIVVFTISSFLYCIEMDDG